MLFAFGLISEVQLLLSKLTLCMICCYLTGDEISCLMLKIFPLSLFHQECRCDNLHPVSTWNTTGVWNEKHVWIRNMHQCSVFTTATFTFIFTFIHKYAGRRLSLHWRSFRMFVERFVAALWPFCHWSCGSVSCLSWVKWGLRSVFACQTNIALFIKYPKSSSHYWSHFKGFFLAIVTSNCEICSELLLITCCYIYKRVMFNLAYLFNSNLLCFLQCHCCKVHILKYCI